MNEKEGNLIEAAVRVYRARKIVSDWVNEQSKQCNLVTHGQAPGWGDYERAMLVMWRAIDAVGSDDYPFIDP